MFFFGGVTCIVNVVYGVMHFFVNTLGRDTLCHSRYKNIDGIEFKKNQMNSG